MKRMDGRTDETSGTEGPSSLQHCDVFTVLVFFGVVNCLWRCQQTVASTFSLSGLVPVLLSFYFATWLPTPEGCRRCTYTNTLCRWLMMVNLLDDELANSPHPPASIAWRYTTNTTRPYFIFHVTVTMRHVGFPFSYTTTTFVFFYFFIVVISFACVTLDFQSIRHRNAIDIHIREECYAMSLVTFVQYICRVLFCASFRLLIQPETKLSTIWQRKLFSWITECMLSVLFSFWSLGSMHGARTPSSFHFMTSPTFVVGWSTGNL